MNETLAPHFSKKILLLSILFLMVNIAWYGLTVFMETNISYRDVAPKLVFSYTYKINIRNEYDSEYHKARPNQDIYTGTHIQTKNLEFAEIILENSIIRMDQNTELILLENNFSAYDTYNTSQPRLVFELKKGNIWVNAFDGIEIKTKTSSVIFSHSVGAMTYNEPMSKLIMITGSADLFLYKNGDFLTQFTVPLRNQVSFTDTQIIPEYSKLKPSKLKKELKMSAVSESVLTDSWVIRNSEVDYNVISSKKNLIQHQSVYLLRMGYYKIKRILTFIPESKRKLVLNQSKTMLDYILGNAQVNKKTQDTKRILDKLSSITEKMQDDPDLRQLFKETFFLIGVMDTESSAYMLKEYLLDYILNQEGEQVFRVYLSDIRGSLENFSLILAEKIANKWLQQWTQIKIKNNTSEFVGQIQIFHSILTAYSDRITQNLLNTFDTSEERHLNLYANNQELKNDFEETLFNITEERLNIGSSLVASYRYGAAKQYLRNSYESLNIDEMHTKSATRKIFLAYAKLLAQRIEYAEQRMHGAAVPIDETEFREYIKLKTRDELLSENLKLFLEVGQKKNSVKIPVPSVQDVIEKFTNAKIEISESNIERKEESIFIFDIKNALLFDRDADGTKISFSAIYDISENGVNNVVSGDMALKGHFELNDLVVILSKNTVEDNNILQDAIEKDISDLLFSDDDENDEILREKITAQNLAKQVVLTQLTQSGIKTGNISQIEIVDKDALSVFYIKNAHIELPDDTGKSISVEFIYNTSSKKADEITILDTESIIKGQIPLDQIIAVIIDNFYKAEDLENAYIKLNNYANQNNLTINKSDVTINDTLGLLEFTNLTINTIPLAISGTFDFEEVKFVNLSHNLHERNNYDLKEYFDELANLYIIDYLKNENITVTEDKIIKEYPFKSIRINNYKSGNKSFSFTLDTNENLLKSVTLLGTGDRIDSMTFEEFKSIAGKNPALPKIKIPITK